MKIIKAGKVPPPEMFPFECKKCGCVWECEAHETSWYTVDYTESARACNCPTCGKGCLNKERIFD
ncbi:MAG: hypothetical protein FWG64_05505 [Firmicutes bacterium]|nr:hypothetical protein [Bacillota bacterium]